MVIAMTLTDTQSLLELLSTIFGVVAIIIGTTKADKMINYNTLHTGRISFPMRIKHWFLKHTFVYYVFVISTVISVVLTYIGNRMEETIAKRESERSTQLIVETLAKYNLGMSKKFDTVTNKMTLEIVDLKNNQHNNKPNIVEGTSYPLITIFSNDFLLSKKAGSYDLKINATNVGTAPAYDVNVSMAYIITNKKAVLLEAKSIAKNNWSAIPINGQFTANSDVKFFNPEIEDLSVFAAVNYKDNSGRQYEQDYFFLYDIGLSSWVLAASRKDVKAYLTKQKIL